MFTRTDIETISEKVAESNISDETAERVNDLIDTCYDAQAGIRASTFLLNSCTYTLQQLDLEPYDNFWEALETLNAAVGLFEIDSTRGLSDALITFNEHLRCASAELDSIIRGTELQLDGMLQWEDYANWCEIRNEAAEQFEDLDDDAWFEEYTKLNAEMFFKEPLMWFFDNKVDETLAKSSKIDDLRAYIAKNTTYENYRKRFAEYA